MIGQIDRDPDSPTFGSCDRHFWLYRLNDFDSGVLQQTSLTLAGLVILAQQTEFPRCRNLKSEHAAYWRVLAGAINRRNVGLFERKGYVDEYYPGEQSYPASAFAAYATLKSALMLGDEEIVASQGLATVARNLRPRDAGGATNQDIANVAFQTLLAKSQGGGSAVDTSQFDALFSGRGAEDGFLEYGGFDVGYATVSLNYLAFMMEDETCADATPFDRLSAMLADFVGPSGQMGGDFGSRSTSYFLPFGVLTASYRSAQLAQRFARLDVESVFDKLDDRYASHYCLPSLVMSLLALLQRGVPKQATSTEVEWHRRHYEGAHLFTCRNETTSVFVALNKGGATQIEAGADTTIDCGYRIGRGRDAYATCVVTDAPRARVIENGDTVQIVLEGPFQKYRPLVAGPMKSIVLRLLGFMGRRLSNYFKTRMIRNATAMPGVRFHRSLTIDFGANRLTIEDRVEGLSPTDVLRRAPPFSLRTVPSAKFHRAGEEDSFMAARDDIRLDHQPLIRTFAL